MDLKEFQPRTLEQRFQYEIIKQLSEINKKLDILIPKTDDKPVEENTSDLSETPKKKRTRKPKEV